jgi:hypothetical protein
VNSIYFIFGVTLGFVLMLLLYSCDSRAMDIEWYDVNDRSVLQVTCNGKEHKLVLKRNEISKKQKEIDDWFEKIIKVCNY